MKPITSLTVCLALLLSSVICAGSRVNNEQEEFNTVQAAILQFQKDTNDFPTSWDDLWNNPASRPSVESLDQGKIFGRRTDMLESFRFIASDTRILLPDDGARVIGMMTRPMRPPPEMKRRFLIVQLKDGTRGLKQIREEVLQKMFSDVGHNLADYTGPNGKWAPETRLRPLSEIPPPRAKTVADSSMDYKTIPALPLSITLSRERKRELWIVGGITLFFLIALSVWRVMVRARTRKKN